MSRGKIMAGGGGLAVMGAFGAETLGAIGVAGSRTDGSDVQCCQAGLTAFTDAHH